MSRSRWIWIVLVNGKPCRFFGEASCSPFYSFATGFGSRKAANAAKVRQMREYIRLYEVCVDGGSTSGAENWKKCLDTICVVRIELPKEVR